MESPSESESALRLLYHGTTCRRAAVIVAIGPDSQFREPGADRYSAAEAFSTSTLAGGPLGNPNDYAAAKSRLFPDEGGPALVWFAIPEAVLEGMMKRDPIFRDVALSGEFEFEGGNLDELLRLWPGLRKGVLNAETES